jgi:hypothetical protein
MIKDFYKINIFDNDSTDVGERFNRALDVYSSAPYWKDMPKEQLEMLKETIPSHVNAIIKLRPKLSYDEVATEWHKWL